MALEGRVAVVTGATGIVGEGIAREFLAAGASVVAPIRAAGKEAGLRAALGAPPADRLITPGTCRAAAGRPKPWGAHLAGACLRALSTAPLQSRTTHMWRARSSWAATWHSSTAAVWCVRGPWHTCGAVRCQ